VRGVGDRAELVARAVDESGTFDASAQRERAALVAFGWSLTGSLPAAEELAQEALAAAWAAWNRVGGFDKPGAWARKVVPTGLRRAGGVPAARLVPWVGCGPAGARTRSSCLGTTSSCGASFAAFRNASGRWELIASDDVEGRGITLRDESGGTSVGTSKADLHDDDYVSTATGHTGGTPAVFGMVGPGVAEVVAQEPGVPPTRLELLTIPGWQARAFVMWPTGDPSGVVLVFRNRSGAEIGRSH
jgi:Sigma-70 region 2